MGSSKSGPEVPDLNQLIGSQVGGNIGLTRANNVGTLYGTSSPYGSTSWNKLKGQATKYTDPYTGEKYKVPKYQQSIDLAPGEQQKYDLSTGLQNKALGMGSELLGSMGNFNPSIYQPGADLSGEAWSGSPLKLGNEATEARLYELGSKRLDPRFARESDTLEAQLTARGLRPGTAAWNAARNQFSEGKNDAYNQLLLSGRAQATDELSREWQSGLAGNNQRFGQLVGARTLGMGEQAQQFGQELGKQGSNIQYLTQLLQAGQPNMPQFTGSQPGASPYMDYAGAMNENWEQQFKNWQQESANKGNMFGGAMSGLAGIIGSDERIKDNIKQVGQTQDGLPIYEFSIGDGEMQTGVMAQDVEKQNPKAVVENAGGIKGVDYPAAVGDGTGTYTVEKGDNIWTIGERLGVDPQAIIAANPELENPDVIFPGQQLVVPGMAAPGPEAVPLAALPAGGPEAVTNALAGPVGPGTAPPGSMPAAPVVEPERSAYRGGPRGDPLPHHTPITMPDGTVLGGPRPEDAAALGLTPEQMQTMMELKRRFPDLQLPAGGMGAY